MSDPEHDEFEAYLKRRVPIDKGPSQLEHLEPPPELDRIVIGKARKAIQGAAPIHLYRAPKWALPVGLAATILISFAVLLDLGVRAKRNDASLQSERPQIGTHAELRTAAGTATAMRAAEVEPSSAAPASNATVTATEPELNTDRARTRLARAEKAAKRARPDVETAAAPSTVSAAATAAPIQSGPSLVSSDNAESKPASAPPDNAPATRIEGSESRTPVTTDPAAWLSRIEKLRAAGHTAEAQSEMKRFRASYPDYPLPKADR